MKIIRDYVAEKQLDFARHPFFARLRSEQRFEEGARFIPRLAFWVMAFQDVLRLNEERTRDSQMRSIARHHRAEDAGHDRWFLADLGALGFEAPDVRALFSPAHAATRDAAYALVAEVFRAEHDHDRMTLVLCLEAIGHIFFEASASYFERVGESPAIKYFSRGHLDVETDHGVFDQRTRDLLDAIKLSPDELVQTKAIVDRTHAAFMAMFDGLLAVMNRLSQRPQLRSEAPPVR